MEVVNLFELAEKKFYKMTDFLENKNSYDLQLSELENYLKNDGSDLLRFLLIGHLNSRGVGDIGEFVIGIDGHKRTHKRIRSRVIKTLFGKIKIPRVGYSQRNISSLFPLDAMLNLPLSNISYVLQKNLILEVIKSSFVESVSSIERWTGVKITTKQAKKVIIEAAEDFDKFYEYKKDFENKHANEHPLMILTCDGKGIVMRYEDLREETQKRAAKKMKQKFSNNTTGKRTDSKRMATVASVYEIDRFIRKPDDIYSEFFKKSESKKNAKRPSPISKRVWASIEKTSENTIRKMFEEALNRPNYERKEWVAVVDGDLNQIKMIKKYARKFDINIVIICDIIHILEYLWKAGKALNEKKKVEQWVSEKFELVLEGKSSYVASGMRRSATFRKLEKLAREPIDTCARYLLNHSDYLRYDEYLKLGYPIATGVIEGACRHLVKDRMGITGARWGLKGAEALLKLRSLKISGDFNTYWKFYESNQYNRNYSDLYKDPSILKVSSQSQVSS